MENIENEILQNEYETDNDLLELDQEAVQEVNTERKTSTTDIFKRYRKFIIFSLLGIIFLLALYLIYAPSKKDKAKQEAEQGLNLNISGVSGAEMPDNKETAYEQANREQKQSERRTVMGALSDFTTGTLQANDTEEDRSISDGFDNSETVSPIGQSAIAYRDIQHTLGNFYEGRSEIDALQQQIDDLQAQIYERDSDREQLNDVQQQLELMEKSYEMAAKYLPQAPATPANPFETAVERPMDGTPVNAHAQAEAKEPTLTVYPDAVTLVSSLYQEVPDSVFMAEQLQERNRHFFSAEQTIDDIPDKNTLKVSVYETVTVKDGETVCLRLLEAARVANMHIPKNALFTAVAKVQGNRLLLSVTSIEHRERIMSVNLSAYGLDGQLGVFIPNSEEVNALKETVAGMGQSAGTSFTFNSSAGQQLAADAGRGIMQGASQYLNKKMREVKVTLKSGHKLFLITS